MIALVQAASLVEPLESIQAGRDPKDNMLLELAVGGKAQLIVSGDSDLLALHPFHDVEILTPKVFLEKFF